MPYELLLIAYMPWIKVLTNIQKKNEKIKFFVVAAGIEPTFQEPKSCVLPLYDATILYHI